MTAECRAVSSVVVVLSTLALALVFGGCGSNEAGWLVGRRAVDGWLRNQVGMTAVTEVTLTREERNSALYEAFTEGGHHIFIEVLRDGPRWYGEHCVNSVTLQTQSCTAGGG
jgi:hypothetical protein